MVDFALTEEEQDTRRMLREFALNEIRPRAVEVDKDPEHKFDWEIIRKAAELDILSMPIPEAYGGAGMPLFTLVLAIEEIAYGDAGTATTIGINWANVALILIEGKPENYGKYLPLLASREGMLSCNACTEASGGSDCATYSRYIPGTHKTMARKDGSDYVLNGTKTFITNAGVADLYLILASLEGYEGRDSTAFFYVPGNAPGLSIGKVEDKMGQRTSPTADVVLSDVRLPEENVFGELGKGVWYVENCLFPISRGAVGALSVGVAQAAYDEALAYARERKQGGKRIIEHQAVAFKLVDMLTNIEAGRALAWKSAWANITTFGASPELSCMAKVFCTDMAMRVTIDAVQIFGGYGYMKDYPVEKFMRDVKLTQIYEGTNDINRLDISCYL
ncbi:MAG: acyl-CoA dehydrogenase family protein [Actinobacteria bacterium]|nr:acyl-CoA dehydrogenase family protein [Actinomycetota bacterium]